jgi:hypothetical protein
VSLLHHGANFHYPPVASGLYSNGTKNDIGIYEVVGRAGGNQVGSVRETKKGVRGSGANCTKHIASGFRCSQLGVASGPERSTGRV